MDEFKTKQEAINHFRKYLQEAVEWTPIKGKAFEDICELIKRHPSASQKIGCGIAEIYVRTNPTYPSRRSFWIRRTNGTETDFSYLRCIDGKDKDQRHWFNQACRWSIVDQIIKFKQKAFECGAVRCAVTGDVVDWHQCHVDHEQPQFAEIVARFIAESRIDVAAVCFLKESDGESSVQFQDSDILNSWSEFHRNIATLRIVKTSINLRRKRNGR